MLKEIMHIIFFILALAWRLLIIAYLDTYKYYLLKIYVYVHIYVYFFIFTFFAVTVDSRDILCTHSKTLSHAPIRRFDSHSVANWQFLIECQKLQYLYYLRML